MKKHAYLIMAHNEFELLSRLLVSLDDPRNDIYLHIDRKSKNVPYSALKSGIQHANLFFIKRMDVRWGDISFVKCELELVKAALGGKYHYYHLISGVDFPLKKQDEIHKFLETCDVSFIGYHRNGDYNDNFLYKVQYYFPLLKYVGKGGMQGKSFKARLNRKLGEYQYRLLEWQKKRGIDRTKKHPEVCYYKGCNWFSITHEVAEFLVNQRRTIYRDYFITNAPDEIFLPTILLNSHFREKIENNSLRLIDWNRGNPYEFTEDDFEEMVSSNALFVRKVSYERNPELINKLSERLK